MLHKRITIAAISGLALIIMTGVWFEFSRGFDDQPQTPTAAERLAVQESDNHPDKVDTIQKLGEAAHATESEINHSQQQRFNLINETYENIIAHSNQEVRHDFINSLRKKLISEPSNENDQAILQFLGLGLDVETGSGFHVDKRGFLSVSPTLRVTLIDVLGIVNPELAADYADQVFATKNSADEWAISLRNVAWNYPETRDIPLLKEKLLAALTHDPWLENPSAGFLHSFDLAVYTQSSSLIPEFTAMLERDNSSKLSHAAIMVMDKMILDNPTPSLNFFLENPGLLADRPHTRAGFFSRADVSDSRQEKLIENYLAQPNLSTEEAETFAKLFPNFNLIISNNLLTENHTYTLSEMAQIDRASLEQAEDWLTDSRYPHLIPQLELLIDRLHDNISSAERGGY
jgi:hypothetical protein